jgi:hypothetical protein
MKTGHRGWQAGEAGWATELEIALVMECERPEHSVSLEEDVQFLLPESEPGLVCRHGVEDCRHG